MHHLVTIQRDFKEWHGTAIAQRFVYDKDPAKLFAPPVFRNEKKASGYFF